MPLPTPRGDESEQDFVSRFMGNDQAVADFPDEKQRAAVAYRTYRDEDEELELPSVSILEEGEAKGHDLFVDKVSLERALNIMKGARNGVKVKMNHGSGLDAVVGFARNPRIEGNRLIADLRLLRNSPHYGLIKEMASEAPDQFGVSLAFVNESETIDGKDYIRPQSIASADLVSSPAATNGLFEEMLAFMEKIKKFDCGEVKNKSKEIKSELAEGSCGQEEDGTFGPDNKCAVGHGRPSGSGGGNKPYRTISDRLKDIQEKREPLGRKIKRDREYRASRDSFNDKVEYIQGYQMPKASPSIQSAQRISNRILKQMREEIADYRANGMENDIDPVFAEDMRDTLSEWAKEFKDTPYEEVGDEINKAIDDFDKVLKNYSPNRRREPRAFSTVAKKLIELAERCWEGYKPTPGVKPYAPGSCMKAEEKFGYMAGGKPIPADINETQQDREGLTKEGENMGNDYTKDIEDIKVRLSALEQAMSPKEEEKKKEEMAETQDLPMPEEKKKEEVKEEMSEVVKKVLTEFGIKPVPASPVTEEAFAKKEEPKNFEALVASHPEYAKSKLTAMKAVMLSNPNEYREALARGIKTI